VSHYRNSGCMTMTLGTAERGVIVRIPKALMGVAICAGLAACGSSTPPSASPTTKAPTRARVVVTTPSTTVAPPSVQSMLLSVNDLPTGWAVDNSPSSSSGAVSGCKGFEATNSKATNQAQVDFDQSGGLPELVESLDGFSSADIDTLYQQGVAALSACKVFTIPDDGQTVQVSMGAMSFPKVGDESNAYTLSFTVDNINAAFDIVVARKGTTIAVVGLGGIGAPDSGQFQQFVTTALNKIPD